MKVITLNHKEFANECRRLAYMAAGNTGKPDVMEESGIRPREVPDLILAIPSGGVYVAEHFRRIFPTASYAELGGRRKGSAEKSKVAWLLRLLPYCISDFLRIRESRILAKRRHEVKSVETDAATNRKIKDARNVLVVDDAVDSGATMAGVIEAVRRLNPEATVRSAAIVVTTPTPIVTPEYTLYNAEAQTLVRFPWSNDFHG